MPKNQLLYMHSLSLQSPYKGRQNARNALAPWGSQLRRSLHGALQCSNKMIKIALWAY
jgi:hypothetical protein